MKLPADLQRREAAKLRSSTRIEILEHRLQAAEKPHGTRLRYMAGCKCMQCRAANSNYETERAAARKAGDWNGIVPADAARKHILNLSRAGVGRRAIAAASDVGATIIADVRARRRLNIRKRTETAILAVTVECASDCACVNGHKAWKQIDELLEEGFTKTELARRLGSKSKTPALQFRFPTITARNAAKVDKLYRSVMAE